VPERLVFTHKDTHLIVYPAYNDIDYSASALTKRRLEQSRRVNSISLYMDWMVFTSQEQHEFAILEFPLLSLDVFCV